MESLNCESKRKSFFEVMTDTIVGVRELTIKPVVRGVSTAAEAVSGAASTVYDSGASVANKGASFFRGNKTESVKEKKVKHRAREFDAAKEAALFEKFSMKLAAAEQTLMKWKKKYSRLEKKVCEHDEFCNKIIGIFAVGIAMAHCDGVISEEEKVEIANFAGIVAKFFPESVIRAIHDIEDNPCSFDVAVRLARQYGVDREDVEMVLYLTAEADNIITPEEWDVLEQWEDLSKELWA